MYTLRLLISLTTTVTFGSSTYFFDSSTIRSFNCAGVKPEACTSFRSGREILPSGRTVTSAVSSLSRQNTIDSTSSAPTVYSGGRLTPGAAATGGGVAVLAGTWPGAAVVGRAGCTCAAHGTAAQVRANAVRPVASVLAILFERNLAVMFSEEIQEPFVIARVHVEDARDDLVVTARFLQTFPDDFAHVRPRDLAFHEQRVDRRPERFAVFGQPFVQIVGDRAAALAPRPEADSVLRPDVGRQIVGHDLRALGIDYQPLDDVLEFTDVPGPRVGAQRLHRGRRDFGDWRSVGRHIAAEEMLHQFGNIFASIAKRRHDDVDDVEP